MPTYDLEVPLAYSYGTVSCAIQYLLTIPTLPYGHVHILRCKNLSCQKYLDAHVHDMQASGLLS